MKLDVTYDIPDGPCCSIMDDNGKVKEHCKFRSAYYKEGNNFGVDCNLFRVRWIAIGKDVIPMKCAECLKRQHE